MYALYDGLFDGKTFLTTASRTAKFFKPLHINNGCKLGQTEIPNSDLVGSKDYFLLFAHNLDLPTSQSDYDLNLLAISDVNYHRENDHRWSIVTLVKLEWYSKSAGPAKRSFKVIHYRSDTPFDTATFLARC